MVGSSINLSDLQSGSFTGYVGSQGVIGYTGSKGEFGGAAFEYNYSNTTSNADPGPGFLRFNSLDLSTATTLYLDFLDVASANSFNYLQTIDDSTSGIKGTFKIEDKANTQVFAFFSITGSHSHPTDYFQVPIAWINGVTSFTNNLDTVTTFVRTGDKGDIGYTGSQGAIGYTGSQGYTGSKGDIGYTGSQGYTGSASTVIGYTGSKGDIGYTGSKGDIGYTGSKGDIGYTGSQGYTGSASTVIGYTGSKGDIGYTGSQGVIGYTGSKGDIGYTGSKGDIGYTGSQGIIGYTGSASTVIGYTGSKGDIGYTGSIPAALTATSLALGGATLGTNNLAVTGTSAFSSTVTHSGATTLSGALTYGGVTLSNAVTGTGSMVLSASPAFTGSPTYTNNQNAQSIVNFTNNSNGANASAIFQTGNGTSVVNFGVVGTNTTPNGIISPNRGWMYSSYGVSIIGDGSSDIRFASGGTTEVARIDTSGNLLVGTMTADNKLTVSASSSGAAAGVLSLVNPNDATGTAADLDFVCHSSGTLATGRIRGLIAGSDNYPMSFWTYGSGGIAERMRLDASGNLLVGTTSSSAPFGASAGFVKATGFVSKTGGSKALAINNAVSNVIEIGSYTAATYFLITWKNTTSSGNNNAQLGSMLVTMVGGTSAFTLGSKATCEYSSYRGDPSVTWSVATSGGTSYLTAYCTNASFSSTLTYDILLLSGNTPTFL